MLTSLSTFCGLSILLSGHGLLDTLRGETGWNLPLDLTITLGMVVAFFSVIILT